MKSTVQIALRAVASSAFVALGAFASFAQQGPFKYTDDTHRVIAPYSTWQRVPGTAHTNCYMLNRAGISAPQVSGAFTPNGFGPAQITTAYNVPQNSGSNAIAVILAFHNTTILSDFNTFANQFGLPKETSADVTASTNKVLQLVYSGGTQPTADAGWAGEECIDMEWTHAMAPQAKIYVVEAPSNAWTDLIPAVVAASKLPGVKEISMSIGGGEFPSEVLYDSVFNIPGIPVFASSGDTGGIQLFPSTSPNVIAVGGTSLVLNSNNTVSSETAWSGSGGGPSTYFTTPSYQSKITSLVGSARGCPDIAGIADPYTGVAAYGQFGFGGWGVWGGTSVASPVNAGMDNARSTATGSFSNGSTDLHNKIYKALGTNVFRDITQGTAGSFKALVGWDFITGCGVPINSFGQTVNYSPSSVLPVYGTYVSGNLASLTSADSSYYVMKSAPSNLGQMVQVETDFNTPSTLTSITANSAGNATLKGVTIFTYAYDYGTTKWDYLGARSATNLSQVTYSLPTGAVSGSGGVRILSYALLPTTYGTSSFTLNLDQVQVSGFTR